MTCDCPLSGRRVNGEGPLDPRIVLIGEAPGRIEDEQGRPFVGPSGQLLRKTLEDMGIDITECYITNTVKCRPPDNRTPTAVEKAACRPELDAELEATGKPKWYVFVGKTAAEAMLGPGIVMKRNANKPMWFRGTKAVIIYHPAAVLRDSTLRSAFEKGLKYLKPPPATLKQTRLF